MRRLLIAAAVVCAALPDAADAEPHVRTGICAGVGFGYESMAWTDTDGDRDVEGAGTLNARIGYALKQDLVLGIEFWGWAKEYELLAGGQDMPAEVKFGAGTLCATYFPGGGGFFVRLGAGIAYGRLELQVPPGVDLPAQTSKTGFAVNFAPGYEWRFTNHFALGAQGDVVYFGLDGPLEDVFGYGINAQFNWYW